MPDNKLDKDKTYANYLLGGVPTTKGQASDHLLRVVDHRAEETRSTIVRRNEDVSLLPFGEAASLWLETKKMHTAAKTVASYGDYITRLRSHFGSAGVFQICQLKEIHIGHLLEYQSRQRERYQATAVNHDLNTLGQILRAADLWKDIGRQYRPLPVPRWTPPRVLTEQEESGFFALAASDPSWVLAYHVATLTNNTSACGKELRCIQLKHVDLDEEGGGKNAVLFVPSDRVKNEYRARVIPLNDAGVDILRQMLHRARRMGSTQPEHFLFPFRIKRNFWDPARHASESWLRKQWKKLVDAAIEQKIISFRVRPHDLRHQIITKLLEGGAPEQTVMAIAGHVSRQMLDHYSHQRLEAKRRVLDLLNPPKKKAAPATNGDVKAMAINA